MAINFKKLETNGFCVLNGVEDASLLDLVKPLGPVMVDPRSPDGIRDISPQCIQLAKPNTLSSRYGLGSFPFHTDAAHWECPPRYLVMYCSSTGEGERPTLLQDINSWKLSEYEMELSCRALWVVGYRRARLVNVATRKGDILAFRYDLDCMRPMTSEAKYLRSRLSERIDATAKMRIDWRVGDLLVLDNYRMVHARGSAERPDSGRVLKRVLLGGE